MKVMPHSLGLNRDDQDNQLHLLEQLRFYQLNTQNLRMLLKSVILHSFSIHYIYLSKTTYKIASLMSVTFQDHFI